MTLRVLDVWWDQQGVGQLTQDRHGELGFAYSPEWLQDGSAPAVSASLPKRVEAFSRLECRCSVVIATTSRQGLVSTPNSYKRVKGAKNLKRSDYFHRSVARTT